MADKKEKKVSVLPWGMTKEGLQPNSVQALSKDKLKAFRLGSMNPHLNKSTPFVKKKEEREEKKRIEEKEAAQVFEDFVASFEGSEKGGKTFVRGSVINPGSTGDGSKTSASGSVYKPTSSLMQKIEERKSKEEQKSILSTPSSVKGKPLRKKGTEKKKSILELFRDELKRKQEDRNKRQGSKSEGLLPLETPEPLEPPQPEEFKVEEYKDMLKGSYDTGDPLTTNLYVGNINPKMNEENLCQLFGKFGPLASVKVMWPRTEEERARNRNCGFVAFMKREDGEKALKHFTGATIMEYEVQVGWGKSVPIPPHPIYVPPDVQEEEKAKVPDPPSGLPFNAQAIKKSGGQYGKIPPPGDVKEGGDDRHRDFDDKLYNSVVRVVIPTDIDLLKLIHRMIEFVIREGPMFEAMIMNKEFHNPKFQFLFENQSPSHVYYRWKLFSILQGDSPETWRTEEFRMFEDGSLWKPPPLKNLRSKVLPPIEGEIVKKGQLSTKRRDELEDQLRTISMERAKIKNSMVWCLDRAESSDEIVECITESLCISETPLPMKTARLYLVSDILHNCGTSVPYVSNFRRGFEGKIMAIFEHFHDVLRGIPSRIRAEQFKRRVLACLRSWDQLSVFHFHLVDKLREVFIGKTHEEMEKQKAFDTVAALMTTEESSAEPVGIEGVSLLDDQPIDFSKVASSIDGVPLEDDNLDGEHLTGQGLDGAPLEDIDGIPMDTEDSVQPSTTTTLTEEKTVKSKWELIDYGDSDDSDSDSEQESTQMEVSKLSKEKQQLMSEVDERKRKMLREVELKVVELTDALESSGGYTKAQISERVSKFREKLMQEAVEPKSSPPRKSSSTRDKSRSPSPSIIAKYSLEESTPHQDSKSHSPEQKSSRKQSSGRSPSRKHSSEGHSLSSHSHEHSHKHRRSRSPARRSRSRSRSPVRKRSRSRSSSPHRSTHSSRHKSPKSRRHRSRSRSPKRSKKRSRSRSPHKSKSSKKKH